MYDDHGRHHQGTNWEKTVMAIGKGLSRPRPCRWSMSSPTCETVGDPDYLTMHLAVRRR